MNSAPLRRAVVLSTISSALVPAAGVLTQPILSHGLGVSGRGELAAALAPALLAVSVATLGLPDALTYYLAKHPQLTRPALLWATLASCAVGFVCLLVAGLALPFLAASDPRLGRLIVLGMTLTVPALVVGVFRGAAAGRQMWNAVAAERAVNTAIRVVAFVLLWLFGHLTVPSAVLVSCLSPVVAGLVYWRLLVTPPDGGGGESRGVSTLRVLMSFGHRVWLGSVASMLLSRASQILMAPLSTVRDLGLYSVTVTISDLPLIIALAIAGALFGVSSAERDAAKVALTARLTLLVSGVMCLVLGGTAPLWVPPMFGDEFGAAVRPTMLMLAAAVICVPSLMAASGLAAWGRPGLRSIGLTVTLIFNVVTFVLLVPPWGVMGACWTSVLTNVLMTVFMVVAASRVMGVAVWDFVLVRRSDVARACRETGRLLARLR